MKACCHSEESAHGVLFAPLQRGRRGICFSAATKGKASLSCGDESAKDLEFAGGMTT